MDIDISTVSPPAETGTDWLPVAAGAGAAGRGVAAAEWRLGLGLSASIHHADTNDTGSKPQWKIYLYVIENNIVCVSSQSSAYLSNPYPTNDLCVSKPGSKVGFIWCPFSFNILKCVEKYFNV